MFTDFVQVFAWTVLSSIKLYLYDNVQCYKYIFYTKKLEILQFSKSISSGIFNASWQMTTDSETMEQYLNFVRTRFLICVLVFVSMTTNFEQNLDW